MTNKSLVLFGNQASAFSISAGAELRNGILHCRYEIHGDRSEIRWPALSQSPGRLDGLWKTTCFEAFLLEANGPAYVEINLSPSGDWNAYSFSDYRQSMKSLVLAQDPVIRVEKSSAALSLSAEIQLPGEFTGEFRRAGLSAVIEAGGKTGYWAIQHSLSQPDFHQAENFVLSL